jgi:hypothetical protein
LIIKTNAEKSDPGSGLPLARLWDLHPFADESAYEGTLISLPQNMSCIFTQVKTQAEKIGEGINCRIRTGPQANPRFATK